MIVTAGTIVGKWEEKYVLDAVRNLSNPKRFDYYTRTFEEEFAKYIGTKYAIAVSNGTAALHLALIALGIGEGDEVILPDLGFVAAANAIRYVGATPIFVDVNYFTWTIDPKRVKEAISTRTKAIMPVYMYGRRPDMRGLKAFGIPIIEDACPAIGTKGAGTYGVGCWSFQGAKTLAIGEGGMVTTNSKEQYDRIRKMYSHGRVNADFYYDEIGYNYRMSNIQAAVGLGQLKHIDELIERKRKIHEWYGEYCSQEFDKKSVCWMNSYHSLVRNHLREYLHSKGIDTRVVFPTMSSYPMYKDVFNWHTNSETIADTCLNLPSASYLTKGEISYVKSCIKDFKQRRS